MSEANQPIKTKPILAISSGGGHWVQLLRLRPAFDGHEVTYVTVRRSYRTDVPGERFLVINDATRWDKIGLVKMSLRLTCSGPSIYSEKGTWTIGW